MKLWNCSKAWPQSLQRYWYVGNAPSSIESGLRSSPGRLALATGDCQSYDTGTMTGR